MKAASCMHVQTTKIAVKKKFLGTHNAHLLIVFTTLLCQWGSLQTLQFVLIY